MNKKLKTMRKFNNYLIETLNDPEEARAYLNVALEEFQKDNNTEAFLLALRDVADARGGLTTLSEKTQLNRQNLYKVLSGRVDPKFTTLELILHGLGFHLSVEANR